MSRKTLEAKAREIRELKRMREELDAEISALEDEVKSVLDFLGLDEITSGEYKISWKAVTSSRIDTAAFKKAMPDLAAQFAKTTTTRRFMVQ